jgi:xylitol oxidase
VAACLAVQQLYEEMVPILKISEVRTVAADDLWMSPFYQQEGVGLHFSWWNNWPDVKEFLPRLEEQLAPFEARPHWGKLFTMDPVRVQSLYERLPDFQRLLEQYDPQGKFRNAFLDTYIFGT